MGKVMVGSVVLLGVVASMACRESSRIGAHFRCDKLFSRPCVVGECFAGDNCIAQVAAWCGRRDGKLMCFADSASCGDQGLGCTATRADQIPNRDQPVGPTIADLERELRDLDAREQLELAAFKSGIQRDLMYRPNEPERDLQARFLRQRNEILRRIKKLKTELRHRDGPN
jgi:hypothetical protein